jgi:hypothetical protein
VLIEFAVLDMRKLWFPELHQYFAALQPLKPALVMSQSVAHGLSSRWAACEDYDLA